MRLVAKAGKWLVATAVKTWRWGVSCLESRRTRREVLRLSVRSLVFAVGVVVGAFAAVGPQTKSASATAEAPRTHASLAAPPTATPNGVHIQPVDTSVRATSGSAPSLAVDTQTVATTSVRSPKATRSSLPLHRGTLIVSSTPAKASVFLNNRFAGRTPLVMREMPAGSRAVRLALDGYAPWSRGVSVVANQQTTVTAHLDQKN
jgi:hypothetical protein